MRRQATFLYAICIAGKTCYVFELVSAQFPGVVSQSVVGRAGLEPAASASLNACVWFVRAASGPKDVLTGLDYRPTEGVTAQFDVQILMLSDVP